MIVIRKDDVVLEGTKLITEASTVGLRPGRWPQFVSVVDERGSGFLFGPGTRNVLSPDGELVARVYLSRTNDIELHILND